MKYAFTEIQSTNNTNANRWITVTKSNVAIIYSDHFIRFTKLFGTWCMIAFGDDIFFSLVFILKMHRLVCVSASDMAASLYFMSTLCVMGQKLHSAKNIHLENSVLKMHLWFCWFSFVLLFFRLPSIDIFGKNISLECTYMSWNRAAGCIHAYYSKIRCILPVEIVCVCVCVCFFPSGLTISELYSFHFVLLQ